MVRHNGQMELPNFSDVVTASERLSGVAVRTPMLRSRALDAHTGSRVFLKPEMLQVSGSFKFHGAYNRICQLSKREHAGGVVAWSSGNHAQGVAAAAAMFDIPATIVMPADAPAIKRDNTLALGAQIITYDRFTESREAIAQDVAKQSGAVIVPSYDDVNIIAGQGTVGLELLQDVAANGESLDALLICCGGGGLSAGCALVASEISRTTDVFTVEPKGFDDYAKSLASGERQRIEMPVVSICDALLTPEPGKLTFAINQHRIKQGLVVSDAEVVAAVRFAFRVLKLVVEPGGAVALAALLSGKLPRHYERVGIILSGGNVDPATFSQLLERA